MAVRGSTLWTSEELSMFRLTPAEPPRLRSQFLGLDPEPPLPFGWEKHYDLQTGVTFFKEISTGMKTSKDPRIHDQLQPKLKDLDPEPWRGLYKSHDSVQRRDWIGRLQESNRILTTNATDEPLWKWQHNLSSKKLPPLLSFKPDSHPSLELSLRLETSEARDSAHNSTISTFPVSTSSRREGPETSAISPSEQPEFQDLLGGGMGPFSSNGEGQVKAEVLSSSMDQSAGACTLEKVLMALERTQNQYENAFNSVSTKSATQNSNLFPPSSFGIKPKLPSSPLVQPSSKKVSGSVSPTSSDASSAVSFKSSRHSSTSPSVMSFQGEELDDLGAYGTSAEAEPRPGPKVDETATLVLGVCSSCNMLVMLSKDNPICPSCGKTGFSEVSPSKKRQRTEISVVDADSRRRWDASPES